MSASESEIKEEYQSFLDRTIQKIKRSIVQYGNWRPVVYIIHKGGVKTMPVIMDQTVETKILFNLRLKATVKALCAEAIVLACSAFYSGSDEPYDTPLSERPDSKRAIIVVLSTPYGCHAVIVPFRRVQGGYDFDESLRDNAIVNPVDEGLIAGMWD